jgi:hypothetical protein
MGGRVGVGFFQVANFRSQIFPLFSPQDLYIFLFVCFLRTSNSPKIHYSVLLLCFPFFIQTFFHCPIYPRLQNFRKTLVGMHPPSPSLYPPLIVRDLYDTSAVYSNPTSLNCTTISHENFDFAPKPKLRAEKVVSPGLEPAATRSQVESSIN